MCRPWLPPGAIVVIATWRTSARTGTAQAAQAQIREPAQVTAAHGNAEQA